MKKVTQVSFLSEQLFKHAGILFVLQQWNEHYYCVDSFFTCSSGVLV